MFILILFWSVPAGFQPVLGRSETRSGEVAISKSVFTREYAIFLEHLRQARRAAGLNQREVAERMQESTLFVSRCERGERRMDVVELCAYCLAIEQSPGDFMHRLEAALKRVRASGHAG